MTDSGFFRSSEFIQEIRKNWFSIYHINFWTRDSYLAPHEMIYLANVYPDFSLIPYEPKSVDWKRVYIKVPHNKYRPDGYIQLVGRGEIIIAKLDGNFSVLKTNPKALWGF